MSGFSKFCVQIADIDSGEVFNSQPIRKEEVFLYLCQRLNYFFSDMALGETKRFSLKIDKNNDINLTSVLKLDI